MSEGERQDRRSEAGKCGGKWPRDSVLRSALGRFSFRVSPVLPFGDGGRGGGVAGGRKGEGRGGPGKGPMGRVMGQGKKWKGEEMSKEVEREETIKEVEGGRKDERNRKGGNN